MGLSVRLLLKLLFKRGNTTPPSFTVTLTALTNATGTVTTQAYIT